MDTSSDCTPWTGKTPKWFCHYLRPLRPNVRSSIKSEVHNVAQRRRRTTKPRPQGICVQNVVPIGPPVPEICPRTDRHTDTPTDTQTGWSEYSAPPTGRSNKRILIYWRIERERDRLTGLSGEDERCVSVIVGEVWINVFIDCSEQLKYWHKSTGAGVTQPGLYHTNSNAVDEISPNSGHRLH